MSLTEVAAAIEGWRIEDELADSPGFCRRSAKKMMEVASAADVSYPKTKLQVVAWPDARVTEDVHYAVRATSVDGDMIFNTSPTSSFPQYLGDAEQAPGLLTEMKPVTEIK